MVAFLFRMPAGIPGAINRAVEATVETGTLLTGSAPTVYGVPLILDAATLQLRAVAAGDTVAMVQGMFPRPYPSTGNGTDGLGVSTPPTSGNTGVLKRGYMEIVVNGTAASAKGGQVYCRVAAPATGKPLGGIEAASDTTNTIALPATFMGAPDANGNSEIAYNL